MKKAEIRKLYLQKKQNLSEREVQDFSAKIFQQFKEYFEDLPLKKVHCFLSIPEKGEVDTALFLKYFFEDNIRVFVPKIYEKNLISVEITRDTELEENSWGIKEPLEEKDCGILDFDLVIIPLLYADNIGHRVGYGKGFYDRFLSTLTEKTTKMGVSFFGPVTNIEDVSPFDIPLDYLVTPVEVLSFEGFTSNSTK